MKSFLALILFAVSVAAFSFPIGYQTIEIYEAITGNDSDISTNAAGIATNVTALKERVKVAHYNLDVSATIDAGTVDTGLDIPAGSIIKQSYYYIGETIVSSDDNTIAFHCETANDLFTATDLTDTATGSVLEGAITASATPADYIYSDGCDVVLTVGAGTSGLTAGDLDFIVEYVDL